MTNTRNQAAALPLLALILMIFSPLAFAAPEPNAVLEVTAEGLTHMEVEFRSREGKELERYQFKADDDGQLVASVALPADAGSIYEITTFDRDGIATYSGKGSIPAFLEGDRPLYLTLPATDQEKDAGGGIVATLSHARVVLEAKALDEPNHFVIRLEAYDPRGNAMKLDPGEIRWGLTDTTHFELLPKEPKDLEVVLQPLDTFPRPVGDRCDVPPKVVMCIPDMYCRTISLCPDPWATVSAGGWHTCALTKSGLAYCWGANDHNELGAKSFDHCQPIVGDKCAQTPLRVECPASSPCYFTQIAAGGVITTALDTNGDVWWWGRGKTGHKKVSALNNGKPVKFVNVTAGSNHGCALSTGGEIWCWGGNLSGETGAPMVMTEVPDFAPVRVMPTVKFSKVVAGGQHTCALLSSGNDVMCWGRDDLNQTTGPNSSAYPSSTGPFHFQHFGGLTPIADLDASESSSCVILGNNNGVSCWGGLATSSVGSFGTPEQLAVGSAHVCALSAQQASCLGSNYLGQLGDRTYRDQAMPVAVSAPTTGFAMITAGSGHTCGLTPNGEIYCWGGDMGGQLGIGTYNIGDATPTIVRIP